MSSGLNHQSYSFQLSLKTAVSHFLKVKKINNNVFLYEQFETSTSLSCTLSENSTWPIFQINSWPSLIYLSSNMNSCVVFQKHCGYRWVYFILHVLVYSLFFSNGLYIFMPFNLSYVRHVTMTTGDTLLFPCHV